MLQGIYHTQSEKRSRLIGPARESRSIRGVSRGAYGVAIIDVSPSVKKKTNGTLRICFDSEDLNEGITKENYPLLTVDAIAVRMKGAKSFSICDIREGFLACGPWRRVIATDSFPDPICPLHVVSNAFRFKLRPWSLAKKDTRAQRGIGRSRDDCGWFPRKRKRRDAGGSRPLSWQKYFLAEIPGSDHQA